METYLEQKQRHHDELNEFTGLFFAFSGKQFNEGLTKVGAEKTEVASIGSGGFIRKDRVKDLTALLNKHAEERKSLKKDTKTLVSAIAYELANHEYETTMDPTDALGALNLEFETLDKAIWRKAVAKYEKNI